MALQHFYMMTPGERLDVGPTGNLYQTMGQSGLYEVMGAEAAAGDAAAAKRELRKMKRSLKDWLKLRKKLEDLATGKRKGKLPAHVIARMVQIDTAGEAKLANDLHALLSEVHDASQLPNPGQPGAAVLLAQIAITGELGKSVDKPVSQGFIPILILTIGGVMLLSLTTFIKNRAEVEKEKLRIECEKIGECSRTSETLLKAGAAVAVAWFAWNKLGLKQAVEKQVKKL